jgi:hypothetical protein
MQTYTVTVFKGTVEWRNSQGQLHRLDGPAVEYANGDHEWCYKGRLHRLDGPAIERTSGYRAWYLHNLRHRTDGPAIEYANGNCEYWVNGQELTKAEFEAQQTKELTVAEVEELLGHRVKIIG